MGALLQPRPSEVRGNTRKGPATAQETTPILDRYGRDPESLPEKLRAQTDYDKGTGYGPSFHAAVVDLVRLSSGPVCYAFCLIVNSLSYGRPRGPKAPVNVWTLPLTAAELGEYCRANVRDIQRQLSELPERGMIAVKQIKQGGAVKYSICLLYSKWQELEDYAVWRQRQIVAIDSVQDEAAEDDEPLPISKEAVRLTKVPQTVRPGRAARAVKVTSGVASFKFQSTDSRVDLVHEAVIQSGCLIVSVASKSGDSEAKGEEKGNAERHPRRALPTNEGSGEKRSKGESARHPRADEINSLFDPLLQKSGARLLSGDSSALQSACAELGSLPHDVLLHGLMAGKSPRASRPITSAKHVASIVRELRINWEKTAGAAVSDAERDQLLKALGLPAWAAITGMQGKHGVANLKSSLRGSEDDPDMTAEQQAAARRLLEILS